MGACLRSRRGDNEEEAVDERMATPGRGPLVARGRIAADMGVP